ncbi:phage tail protein [Nevskia sp.]|uniref:phage tail protein n=1 Tax=Nevskia sp. TaxID=1929292 RepID=UPI0025F18081|nr:phage tail protein [Nevskia sp.]
MSAPRLLELLPALYRADPQVGKFLTAFEAVLFGLDPGPDELASGRSDEAAPLETQIDRLADTFSAFDTPREFLPWLASWVGLSLRADLDEQQQRQFLAETAQRYRRRGTPGNLIALLKLFTRTTIEPTIEETGLHHFKVTIVLPSLNSGAAAATWPAFVDRQTAIARSIIELEKPAHTSFELHTLFVSLQIGIHSTVGVDTLLGTALYDS